MKNYKVEITKTYCIDVNAKDEKDAEKIADNILDEMESNDNQHYNLTGDNYTVYDVTNTDDSFNPEN